MTPLPCRLVPHFPCSGVRLGAAGLLRVWCGGEGRLGARLRPASCSSGESGVLGTPGGLCVLGPPKAAGRVSWGQSAARVEKEGWLQFQWLWLPQENCQGVGDSPTEAGYQPLFPGALWFEEAIDASCPRPWAPKDPQRTQGAASALLATLEAAVPRHLLWPKGLTREPAGTFGQRATHTTRQETSRSSFFLSGTKGLLRIQSLDGPPSGDVRLRDLKGETAKRSQVFGGGEVMEVEPRGGMRALVEEARELSGCLSAP